MARTGDLVPKDKAFSVMHKHIAHAQELLESAKLLIRAKHYQTGFALATYTNESIMKALILWSYGLGFLGMEDYQTLEKPQGGRHDQRQKLALILLNQMHTLAPVISRPSKQRKKKSRKKRGHYSVMNKVQSTIPSVVQDIQEQWNRVHGTFWENAKRQALYVDWDATLGRVPDHPDWEALALEARSIAQNLFDYLREINKPDNIRKFRRHSKDFKQLIQQYVATPVTREEQFLANRSQDDLKEMLKP